MDWEDSNVAIAALGFIATFVTTMVGVWLTNLSASRRARDEREHAEAKEERERGKEAARKARDAIDSWWLALRSTAPKRRHGRAWVINHRHEDIAGRAIGDIPDERVRHLVRDGLYAARDILHGPDHLLSAPSAHQRRIMASVVHVLQAHGRGNEPEQADVDNIRTYFDLTTAVRFGLQ